jgi:hypothetical protein
VSPTAAHVMATLLSPGPSPRTQALVDPSTCSLGLPPPVPASGWLQPCRQVGQPPHGPHIVDGEDTGLRLSRVQRRMTEITICILYMKDIRDILNLVIEESTYADRGQHDGRHQLFSFQTSPDGLAGAFEAAH